MVWRADDENDDELLYDVWYRREGDVGWNALRRNVPDSILVWDTATVVKVLFTNYLLKVGWEAVATPLTYRIVAFLKRREHEDWYDRDTDFTPFSLSVE